MPFSDKLVGGATYHISAYVKQVSGKATQIKATQELDGSWNQIGAVDNAASGEWVFVEGDMKVPHGYSSISLIFEMPNDSNSDFYVDNVSVVQVTEAAEEEKLPSLKEVYKDIFPHFGTCAAYSAGWASVKQASTLKFITSQYNSITLENEMKPQYLMNRNTMSVADAKAQGYLVPDDYKESTVMTINMSNVDEILQYVYDNGLQVRGHTLLWHSQTPTWFFKENYSDSGAVVKPEVMDKRIELYVGTVMNHVLKKEKEITGKAGSIVYAWDVTNEYINRKNDPTNPSWVDVYGDLGLKPTYVKKAYEEAYKQLKAFGVEKDVTLFYNDYNTYLNKNYESIIKLLDYVNEGEEAMICSGVGMQSHIDVGSPKPKMFGYTVQTFLDHGFEVQITELDITINYNGYSSGRTAEDQAVYAKSLFETLIDIQKNVDKTKSKGITGITVWGLYDSVSWRRDYDPLFFTSATTPKPSFYAIIEAATE